MQQPAKVILYSKPGCHLCETMKAEMAKANCAHLYQMEEINIEMDEQLLARYQNDIPVLKINGIEAFKHRVRADEFEAFLSSLSDAA